MIEVCLSIAPSDVMLYGCNFHDKPFSRKIAS